MPHIKVNDINMYYEVHGQGEPLVLVSGFSADHLSWSMVLHFLAKKYQVILLDNRGAGRTDVPEGSYSIEQMASDIEQLCVNLNIRKAHFIGNSMGGFLVQMIAYRYPELVKSIVISNSAMVIHSSLYFYLLAQHELMKANAPAEALIKAGCSWTFSYQFLSKSGMLDQLVKLGLSNPYPFGLTGYEGQLVALEKFDSRSWAKDINAPTLVVSSDQDLILGHHLSEALVKNIPGAQYYCFEDCGHLPHIEYPEQFVAVVCDFLDRL